MAELLKLAAVRDALVESGVAAAGTALMTALRQRAALQRLRAAGLDPDAAESTLRSALDGEWWLFGGRFIGQEQRRSLTVLDQPDILLLRAGGSLHVVELKRANVTNLVIKHRNHQIVGSEVNAAVGQAMNYLRGFDEHSAQIHSDFDLDTRRATATVVIGHPQHARNCPEHEVHQTLRTYNSHLARVEVITYSELLTGAAAALDLVEDLHPDSTQNNTGTRKLHPDPHSEPPNDPWATAAAATDIPSSIRGMTSRPSRDHVTLTFGLATRGSPRSVCRRWLGSQCRYSGSCGGRA